MNKTSTRWILLAVITTAGFLADWGTKSLVISSIEPGAVRPVIGDVLQWTLAFNPGAVNSLNPADWIPGFPTREFYMAFTILGLVLIAVFYGRLDATRYRWTLWGLALVMPGAAGNLLDRILGRPGVVDFIRVDLGFPPVNPWPIFNLADIYITFGAILLILDSLRKREREDDGAVTKGAQRDAPRGSRRRRK